MSKMKWSTAMRTKRLLENILAGEAIRVYVPKGRAQYDDTLLSTGISGVMDHTTKKSDCVNMEELNDLGLDFTRTPTRWVCTTPHSEIRETLGLIIKDMIRENTEVLSVVQANLESLNQEYTELQPPLPPLTQEY